MQKLLFRANARLGRSKKAQKHFFEYVKHTKKIAANLGSHASASTLLDHADDRLMLSEFKMIAREKNGAVKPSLG